MQSIALALGESPADIELYAPQSAFCITVYNEKLASLKRTLASLVTAVAHRKASVDAASDMVWLCIILDGAKVADPAMLEWLRRFEIIRTAKVEEPGEYGLHFGALSEPALWDLCDGAPDAAVAATRPQIRLIVCLKDENRGKLHSHALFFREICAWLSPAYCFQIDAGTVVSPGAYATLLQRMADESNIGALAPCIMAPQPNRQAILLSTWQYMDFVLQKSLQWPVEVAAGHLSVIPGQFCMFRWRALCAGGGRFGAEALGDGDEPLDAYLRGLRTTDPLERVMFLAEDRVIGNEIVLRTGESWRLTYSPEAHALTDACDTLGELMRQRRRWNNSALACRIALLAKTPAFLARTDRTVAEKVRFSLAMFCQLVCMMVEATLPALGLAGALSIFGVMRDAVAIGAAPLVGFALGSIVGILLTIILGKLWTGRGSLALLALVRGALGVASNLAMLAILVLILPLKALGLLLTPVALGLVAIALMDRRWLWKTILLNNVYAMANVVLAPLIAIYAVLNLHDVSWGTKGLVGRPDNTPGRARMLDLRTRVLSVWLSANVGVCVAAFSIPGLFSASLNIVVEAAALIAGVGSLVAVFHLCVGRLRGARRSTSASRALFSPQGVRAHG